MLQKERQSKSWKWAAIIAAIDSWVRLSNLASIGNRIQWHCTIYSLGQSIHCLQCNTRFEDIQMNNLQHKVHFTRSKFDSDTEYSCSNKVQNSSDSLRSIVRKSCTFDRQWILWDSFLYIHFDTSSSFICRRSISLIQRVLLNTDRTFDFGS